MAEAQYLKPQIPLKKGEDYFYPLTTDDQVILSDGRRLNQVDFNDSQIIFVGSNESFPTRGDSGKIYVKNNYLYIWNGVSYQILSVQTVNGKSGQVELTAADVGALNHPSDVSGATVGSYLVIQSITNGRINVGFASMSDITGGFIEAANGSEPDVPSRRANTLYGVQMRVISGDNEQSVISYSN